MNFRRKIELFLVSYGRLLFICLLIVLGILFILRSINDYVKQKNYKSDLTEEEKVSLLQEKEEENKDKELIFQFIKLCKNGEIQKAYSMLSSDCKQESFIDINIFKENYINNKFKIKIIDYKINKENKKYIITLKEDMLMTGKKNSTKQTIIGVRRNEEIEKIYIYE